jgi:xanthine dehydrogenase YagT iron-sulfur-binding subunit
VPSSGTRGLTRRELLAAALGAALVLSLPLGRADAQASPRSAPPALLPSSVGTVPVTLHVNGTAHTLQIEPRVTLLDALRERIGLTGSKKGCDHGQCGACTVHADGKRINSCLALAVAYQNKQITTIEGLADGGDALHPVQAAFIRHDGFQCGFCTSGQIMSATALLKEPVGPTDADVRENMSGNLCRCGAYTNIVAAIQEVRGQDMRKEKSNAPV